MLEMMMKHKTALGFCAAVSVGMLFAGISGPVAADITPQASLQTLALAEPMYDPVAHAIAAGLTPEQFDAQLDQSLTVAETCPMVLDVAAPSNSAVTVSLVAPCLANQTVVLHHADMTLTQKTSADGALFTAFPAADGASNVEVVLADGRSITKQLPAASLMENQQAADW